MKNNKSILVKLWFAMTLLVLFVLVMTTLVQNNLLQRTYYQQQQNQLILLGQNIAETVIVETDLEAINNVLKNAATASATSIVLLDNQARLVTYHAVSNQRQMQHRMGMMRMQRENIVIPSQIKENLNEVLRGKVITARGKSNWLNTEVLYVAVPLLQNERAVGILLIYAPVPDITTRLKALQGVSIYTALGGVILAALVSLVLSRTLVKPLLEMNNVAKAMAEGKYGKKVRVKSDDEVGMLAHSINSLSAQLEEKIYNLERLDETRRDFVASISHELRTPLTIMQGYTEALQDGLAHDHVQRQRYIDYIHDEILRLRRLVDELLNLRRLESGQISINPTQVNVNQLIQRLLKGIVSLAEEKKIEIFTILPPDEVCILVDEDRLAQVFINLLDNALRVTQTGGQINVKVQARLDILEISVADTGPGIAMEDLPLIWERFYKVDKSRTRTGHGTGLGLAISKKIIELHQGTIEVTSTVGQGSTFTIKLPYNLNKVW